jgi:hypothetical protein
MCVLAALTLLVGNIRLPRQRLVEAVDVAEAWLAVVLLQHINHERNALFHGIAGLLGTGEAGMGPTPAAIANALANATGLRLRDLPLTAAKVKQALLG